MLTFSECRLSFLLPIGESGILPLLKSIKTTYFAFIGFELIAFLYPSVTDKEKALKWHFYANIISMLFLAAVVAACTSIFGVKMLSMQIFPFFNLARIYNLPILERADIYLTAAWFMAMGCSARAYIMVSFDGVLRVLNLKKSKLVFFIFIVVILAINGFPYDINNVFIFFDVINYFGLGIGVFFILCLVVSMFNKKGVTEN